MTMPTQGPPPQPVLGPLPPITPTIKGDPQLGLWFGYLPDYAAWSDCLEQIAEHVAILYETENEAAYDAATRFYRDAPPAQRLHFYEVEKSQDMWNEQQAKFPRDWEKDDRDRTRLRALAAEGRLAEG